MIRPGTQSTFLKFFRCSRFSEFDSNVLSNFLILSDTFIFNFVRFEGKIDGILILPINSTILRNGDV